MQILRNEGDIASDCPTCGGSRVWKIAKRKLSPSGNFYWRQYCSPCHSARSYASRRKNMPRARELQRRQRERPEQRAALLFRNAKKRAKARGLDFDLDLEYCKYLMERCGHKCAVTGVGFNFELGGGSQRGLAPSLDQIVPGVGYVKGNVRIVTWIYNRAKGDGTDAEVMEFAKALIAARNDLADEVA